MNQLPYGTNWSKHFYTNIFHHIRQPSFRMRLLLSRKMEVRLSIRLGRGLRNFNGNVHIMVCQNGWSLKSFTMDWPMRIETLSMQLLVENRWTKQTERPLHCLRNLHLKGTWVKKPMAKARGVLELDTINMLSAKVDALTKMVSKSQVNSLECTNLVCETCGGPHSYS